MFDHPRTPNYSPLAVPFKREAGSAEFAFFKLCGFARWNPVKAGLVVRPEEWRLSSVHDFSGRAAGPIVANNFLAIDRVELPLDHRARI